MVFDCTHLLSTQVTDGEPTPGHQDVYVVGFRNNRAIWRGIRADKMRDHTSPSFLHMSFRLENGRCSFLEEGWWSGCFILVVQGNPGPVDGNDQLTLSTSVAC